jgi:hypothetical protein
MRSRILSLLTSTAIVLHALLGCCAHHSHAGQETACEQAVTPRPGSCGCRHREAAMPSVDETPADDEPGERPHGHEGPCDGPECQFVGLERSHEVEQTLSVPVWVPLSDLPGLASATLTLNRTAAAVRSAPLISAPSLRAVTQVWLL